MINKVLLLILLDVVITLWLYKNISVFLKMHIKALEIKMTDVFIF